MGDLRSNRQKSIRYLSRSSFGSLWSVTFSTSSGVAMQEGQFTIITIGIGKECCQDLKSLRCRSYLLRWRKRGSSTERLHGSQKATRHGSWR
jgi:hypothetical protein